MRKTAKEVSSRGVADISEGTIEVPCDALDCLYNDKSREAAVSGGFCTLASVPIRKGQCVSYKMDKKWMKYTLRRYLNPRVFFPKDFKDNKEWSEG